MKISKSGQEIIIGDKSISVSSPSSSAFPTTEWDQLGADSHKSGYVAVETPESFNNATLYQGNFEEFGTNHQIESPLSNGDQWFVTGALPDPGGGADGLAMASLSGNAAQLWFNEIYPGDGETINRDGMSIKFEDEVGVDGGGGIGSDLYEWTMIDTTGGFITRQIEPDNFERDGVITAGARRDGRLYSIFSTPSESSVLGYFDISDFSFTSLAILGQGPNPDANYRFIQMAEDHLFLIDSFNGRLAQFDLDGNFISEDTVLDAGDTVMISCISPTREVMLAPTSSGLRGFDPSSPFNTNDPLFTSDVFFSSGAKPSADLDSFYVRAGNFISKGSLTNGAEEWLVEMPSDLSITRLVGVSNNVVYAAGFFNSGSELGVLVVVDKEDGSVLSTITIDQINSGSVIFHSFCISENGVAFYVDEPILGTGADRGTIVVHE